MSGIDRPVGRSHGEYGWIKDLRQQYSVAALCRMVDVSEHGYHPLRQRPQSGRAQNNARLKVEIKAAHDRTRQSYSPERLQADLADKGIRVGIYRIKRIRKNPVLRCRQKRKFRTTPDSRHSLSVAPDLCERPFAVIAPNKAWETDIAYIPTD